MLKNEVTNNGQASQNEIVCTVDEAITHIGIGRFQFKILIVTGLLWAADGIEIMILTFLLPTLQDEWNLTDAETGTIGSVGIHLHIHTPTYIHSCILHSVFLGICIGAIFWSNLSDRIGRKWGVLGSNIGELIFGMLSALSTNLLTIIIFRFLTGFCLGGSSSGYTLYAEYAPNNARGRLLLLQQGFWAIGCTVNCAIAWFALDQLDWRWYLVISSFPLCVILIFTVRLPESVRYLAAIGQIEKAQNILNKALRENESANLSTIKKIKLNVEPMIIYKKRGNIKDVFGKKYFQTSVLLYNIGCLTCFAYYGISFLSERFFDKVTKSEDPNDKYWKILVTTSSEIPGVLLGMLTLDRYGRKYTMIGNYFMFSVCTFALIDSSVQNTEWLSVTLVFFSRMSISMAFLALYVYFSEFYPTMIRNTALGFAVAISRLAGMATTYVSQYDDMTYSFYLYGLAGGVTTICCFMLVDTKGNDMSAADEDMKTELLPVDENESSLDASSMLK